MGGDSRDARASGFSSCLGLLSRRDLLRVGSLFVSASAASATGVGAGFTQREASARSVIVLWMGGGVTHIDSFDPKPHAPQEVRGTLTAISTALAGVQFCQTLPELAKIADRLAVVRSFSHDSNDHLISQVWTLSGKKVGRNELFKEPNIGSVVARLQGPRAGLPGYIAVPGITRPGPPPHNLFVGGWLGRRYAPFAVGGQPEQPDFTATEKQWDPSPVCEEDLTPQALSWGEGLSVDRLSRRERLLDALDRTLRESRGSRAIADLEGTYGNAFRMLLSPQVRGAFDLSAEPDWLRERYGRTKIGGRCLLARRLVEAGARFVMVDYGYDPDYGNLWDNHCAASQKHPPISQMCLRGYHLVGMDRAFAALLRDLEERGLLDSTLVVFLTEFGRTPKINARGGRDHWGAAGSIFFAGGGTQGGQVIGATDAQAAFTTTAGYSPADVAATIYQALGIDLETRLRDRENRPHTLLDHGRPIPGVL